MKKKTTILYLSCILAGFLVSLLIQNVDYQDLVSLLKWIRKNYTNSRNQTSLALLTLVDQEKKSFSVAVLPPKEIAETEDGMTIYKQLITLYR